MENKPCQNCTKLAKENLILQMHVDSLAKSNNSIHIAFQKLEKTTYALMNQLTEATVELDQLQKRLHLCIVCKKQGSRKGKICSACRARQETKSPNREAGINPAPNARKRTL